MQKLPQQLTLKTRAPGQGTAEEVATRDLRKELEERERAQFEATRRERERRAGRSGLLLPG